MFMIQRWLRGILARLTDFIVPTPIWNAIRPKRRQAERIRQLEAVKSITQEITRERDLTALLRLITRRAMELVGAASSATHLWDDC